MMATQVMNFIKLILFAGKKDKKIELTYFEIEAFLDETEKFFDDLVPMIKSKNEEKIL